MLPRRDVIKPKSYRVWNDRNEVCKTVVRFTGRRRRNGKVPVSCLRHLSRPLARVVHRAVRKGFATLAVKGAHFRSFRAPSSRVQPLTFDPLRAAPDRSPGFYFRLCPSC
jgi:hypothetical protein